MPVYTIPSTDDGTTIYTHAYEEHVTLDIEVDDVITSAEVNRVGLSALRHALADLEARFSREQDEDYLVPTGYIITDLLNALHGGWQKADMGSIDQMVTTAGELADYLRQYREEIAVHRKQAQ